MDWLKNEMHQFSGIAERLKRADQNIVSLHNEIDAFFKGCKYSVIPDPKSEEWQQAVNYHRDLAIPKRFSVLTGEVVHHLRSCLDHIAWHFSNAQYRIDAENAIEFPVFREDPANGSAEERRRFQKKVKGITNARVLSIIGDMQPYQRGVDAEDDPICIVHDMDRFDKHRELAIINTCASVVVPPDMNIEASQALDKFRKGETLTSAERALVGKTVTQDAIVTPQVAFAKIGKREGQFVVPSLMELFNAIEERIGMFAGLA